MSGAQSISTRRAYGVQRVCRVWHCARSSVYARRQATPSPAPCRRRGPVGAAPDDVLVAHVRRVLEASPFHGEGYRKVWAKLRVEGRRTSKERVRRLMREHDLQAPQRAGHAHGPKAHDGTITTEAPDVMWGTDMTATVTVAEGPAFVFVAVDHCTAECIGLHAAKRGTRFEALEPIRQGIRERFGGIGEGVARGLRLRHDHGSNYLADDFQQEVAFFGIESSPSFVREPEGNGVAERFIRTLKENLLWVRSFATIEELRLALLAFKRTYNEHVDAGEIPLSKPRPGATRPRRAGRGSVEANTVKPLSKNLGAVHAGSSQDTRCRLPRTAIAPDTPPVPVENKRTDDALRLETFVLLPLVIDDIDASLAASRRDFSSSLPLRAELTNHLQLRVWKHSQDVLDEWVIRHFGVDLVFLACLFSGAVHPLSASLPPRSELWVALKSLIEFLLVGDRIKGGERRAVRRRRALLHGCLHGQVHGCLWVHLVPG